MFTLLYNKTKKTKVIERVRIANNFFSMLKGLMFERKKNFSYALVFELPVAGKLSAAIHSFFVFFPFDIVFLDTKKMVVETQNIKPFTPSYVPKQAAKYFIELPSGMAKEIRIGDVLEWNKIKEQN